MSFFGTHVKTVHKNAPFLGLCQNLFQVIICYYLFFEILHDFGPSLFLVFVFTHY